MIHRLQKGDIVSAENEEFGLLCFSRDEGEEDDWGMTDTNYVLALKDGDKLFELHSQYVKVNGYSPMDFYALRDAVRDLGNGNQNKDKLFDVLAKAVAKEPALLDHMPSKLVAFDSSFSDRVFDAYFQHQYNYVMKEYYGLMFDDVLKKSQETVKGLTESFERHEINVVLGKENDKENDGKIKAGWQKFRDNVIEGMNK